MAASKKKETPPPATPQHFPIVGVGASAGGLDAFKRLLSAVPEKSGMAYVLVQHLSPTHESLLPEILQRVTKIPVHEITDEIHLAPDHIYVIPSNKILTSTNGVLCLSPRENFKMNLPIDIFFKSLAEVHKELAAGVVLSGTGSDGTIGLKAIKDYGGITIAQDQSSAAYNDMPQNAIDTGVVDFVLPPEEIPAQLQHISSKFSNTDVQDQEESLPKDDESSFNQILTILQQRSGVDFKNYKQSTIRRRVARRIDLRKKEKLSSYLKFLRSNKAEQDALFQDMLIPVTSFFRDPETFETLSNTIFPLLFKNRTSNDPMRVWIAGCSTGEEAYSFAICLHEFMGEKAATVPIQIFASDISEVAIKKARTGIYPKDNVQMLSEERKTKYFRKTDGHYEVNKLIRDICVFAPHNFLKDPPFAKMDLISCRNVLIYLDNFLQKKALTTFHYSLKLNGYLILGKSETISAAAELFAPHDKHEKIYSRKPVPGRFMHVASEKKEESLATRTKAKLEPEKLLTDFRKNGEAILLNRYTPAAVIVNDQMDIVHIHSTITPFLEQSPGKPSFNLLKMAREGLSFELRNALHKVKTTKKPFIKKNIPSTLNGQFSTRTDSDGDDYEKQNNEQFVDIEVVPLTNTVEPYYLVLFSKSALADGSTRSDGNGSIPSLNADAKQRIAQLERELAQAREDMRSISEDQEAANEELQSANEELQSSNEEMQSLNEELETSKEELQSTNEELITVNHELLDKQEQLNATRYYAENIVSTVPHPLIVLDKTLRIRTANTSFYKKFETTEEATEGKLFYEIQNQQWDDSEMLSQLEKLFQKKAQLTDFAVILKFPLLGERNLLLNGRQLVDETNPQKLILLAIEDVTERKSAELKLQKAYAETEEKNRLIEATEKRFSNIFSHSIMAIGILKGAEMVVSFVNQPLLEIWGKGPEIAGKPLLEAMPGLKNQQFLRQLHDVYTTGIAKTFNENKTILLKDGKPAERFFSVVIQPYTEVSGTITGVTVIGSEVTNYVNAKRQIEESEEKFRVLAETLPYLVWITDEKGEALYASKNWQKYSGSSPYETGNWKSIIHPDDLEALTYAWATSLASGKHYHAETRIKNKYGSYRWHVAAGVPLKNADDEIVKWIGAFTDIHEQKIKEQHRDDFISIASHELKTPLTTAKGYIELLLLSLNEDNKNPFLYATKAGQAINRLNTLITELLDVSKIQHGKIEFDMAMFDFNKLMDETIENIAMINTSHQLIKTGNIALEITGDKDRLQQVIINLLTNAIKYSPKENKVLVTVAAKGRELQVSVEDYGIGINTDYLDKIFERYYRVKEQSTQFQGMGIGLFISYEIIKRHEGNMWVKSDLGKGSTFYFTIPI